MRNMFKNLSLYLLKFLIFISLIFLLFVFRKVIKNIPVHPESNIMYIRYLLIYCLWKKINSDIAVRSQIITTAIASLGAPPAAFPPCVLEDVLPKVPKCQPNSAKYLMQQKFDIKKCCELFIQFCRESRGSTCQQKSENAIPSSSKRTTSQLVRTQYPRPIVILVSDILLEIILRKNPNTKIMKL